MKSNDFNGVAKWYDQLASVVFGDAIKKAQVHFLNELPQEGKLLIIGGGTGWILNEIVRIRPKLKIDFVEASSKMIDLAKKQTPTLFGVQFMHCTEEAIPENQYAAVITNFFLDVFEWERLEEVMQKLKNHLAQQGIWLFTDFQKTGRFHHAFLIKVMHFFFRMISNLESKSLNNFEEAFQKLNLTEEEKAEYFGGMICSKVYRFT